tara:strand:- start:1375 stop:1677 length:303 start_codon:yes stop_codon:yes gene_type:complete
MSARASNVRFKNIKKKGTEMRLIGRTPPPPGMVYRRIGEKVELDGGECVVEKVSESSAVVRVLATKEVSYTDTATGKHVCFKARSSRLVHISPTRERGSA